MSAAPVLFLDVDGVLNHRRTFMERRKPPLCPDAVGRLHKEVTSLVALLTP